jgi:TonB family protein
MAERNAKRVGAPLVEASLKCDGYITKRALPTYPASAIQHKQEGWVVLGYVLDGTGRASNIIVVSSSPKRVFEQSAIEAMKQLEFKMGVVNAEYQALFTYVLIS